MGLRLAILFLVRNSIKSLSAQSHAKKKLLAKLSQ